MIAISNMNWTLQAGREKIRLHYFNGPRVTRFGGDSRQFGLLLIQARAGGT